MWVNSREQWNEVRPKGVRRFVLLGGLMRGIPMGLAVAAAIELTLGNPFPEALASSSFLGRAFLAGALFTAGGCATAYAQWRTLERRFGKSDMSDWG